MHFAEQKYKPTTLNTPPSSPLHRFREAKFEESQIKSKTVMRWSSRKKRENIFCIVHFVRGKFVFYLNVWYIEYTFRIQWTLSNSNSQGEFEFVRIMESSDYGK